MSQPDSAPAGSQATGTGGGGEPSISCCPVCMEPPEWVAAGPCGHHEVGADCAVRLRFQQDNRRCPICRAFCPTVVITRVVADDDNSKQAGGNIFPKPPPAFGGAGRVGMYYWYHGGTGAYFDDPEQYEAVRNRCLNDLKPPPPPPPCPAPADGRGAPPAEIDLD